MDQREKSSPSSLTEVVHDHDSLTTFIREFKKFPMLEADHEYQLATQWQSTNDPEAMEKLLGSHLRLVFKIAQGYRGYGLALHDLVAEGNIGLLQALHKFDPQKGFRFSTYALWWIRAAVQEYVLRNWSLVRIGTTAAQKKLFFKLKTVRRQLDDHNSHSNDDVTAKIADHLKVSHKDVTDMSQRLQAQDFSLNAHVSSGEDGEWQDWLEASEDNHETHYLNEQEMDYRRQIYKQSVSTLKSREHHIFTMRRLHEPPKTLDELALQHNISKERVRQIEVSAFQKLQTEVCKHVKKHIYH